jgi:xanthine/uracil permease
MGGSYSASATAVAVATDTSQGIIDRFRTMAIARSAVLTGHVIGSVLRTMIGLVPGRRTSSRRRRARLAIERGRLISAMSPGGSAWR